MRANMVSVLMNFGLNSIISLICERLLDLDNIAKKKYGEY